MSPKAQSGARPPYGALCSALLGLTLLSSTLASAQAGWRDGEGKPAPDTAEMKSRDGFSAMLIITADADWEAKWDTPPETAPRFSSASSVSNGGELHILTSLANPALDSALKTDVTCDFKVVRPDGSLSIDQADSACFRTTLKGDPRNVYLSAASMKFIAEPSDLRGTWRVLVVVKDNLRHVELPLESSFRVE